MLRISNIQLFLGEPLEALKEKASKKLKVSPEEILEYRIFRRSLDARKRGELHFNIALDVSVKQEEKILKRVLGKGVEKAQYYRYEIPILKKPLKQRPVIVGFGPAGMFSALLLAKAGLKPIVLERGNSIEYRTQDVDKFFKTGILDCQSNIQFGEGGAGTFSDGKLTTRIKDACCRYILECFVQAGAPEEILLDAKPHIGTDILKIVVQNMRKEILKFGGEIRFLNKLTDIAIKNGAIEGIEINQSEFLPANHVILATGHSARDTFELLFQKGIVLEQKPFAVGVRIEHLQQEIDKIQYGKFAGNPALGAADYKLTYTTKKGRGVYTFCMCPGGYVVAASSEKQTVVTNGMSNYHRDGQNSNSALLVQVVPEDFDADDPLAGIRFQRHLEEKAFILGGKNYKAPVQRVGDFLNNKESIAYGKIKPTYQPGTTMADLNKLFPEFILEALHEALPQMGKKFSCFLEEDAVITAVESRSSSPVRILRDNDTRQSVCLSGLYPVGEGAGYAGGIISSAVDGLHAAEKLIEECNRVW